MTCKIVTNQKIICQNIMRSIKNKKKPWFYIDYYGYGFIDITLSWIFLCQPFFHLKVH